MDENKSRLPKTEEYQFYFLFFLVLSFLMSSLTQFSFGDLGVWISEGQQILLQKTIYIKDVHSFNATLSYPYPWLSSLFYAGLDFLFGVKSIFLLHRIIPLFIIAFWMKKNPPLLYRNNWGILCLSLLGLQMIIIDRPALLTLPFFIYFYEKIESQALLEKKWINLFLFILWTNLHGSFILIPILYGYKIVSNFVEKRNVGPLKESMNYLSLLLAGTLINPWGYKIYEYVYLTASVSKVRMLEWQSVNFFNAHATSSILFVVSVIIVTLFIFYKKFAPLTLKSPILIITLSAFNSVRNIPLFYVALPIFLTDKLSINSTPSKAEPSRIKFLINRIIIGGMMACALFFFFNEDSSIRNFLPQNKVNKYDDTSCLKISEYLNTQGTPGFIFNEWNLGSYLIYSQKNKIFIDTRNIIYPNETAQLYDSIIANVDNSGPGILKDLKIKYVIVGNYRKALISGLEETSEWNKVMVDNDFILYELR